MSGMEEAGGRERRCCWHAVRVRAMRFSEMQPCSPERCEAIAVVTAEVVVKTVRRGSVRPWEV